MSQVIATFRIEFVSSEGVLCVVERGAHPLLHKQDPLSIQMMLCGMAVQMLPGLAEQIACGLGDEEGRG
jgi:hypothetical protein